MRVSRVAVLALVTASLALMVVVGGATAATTTIDFEAQGPGPSLFCPPPQTLTIGVATFSGGALLTAATNLPADQTTVYGTAAPCAGYAPVITITFSRPVSNFSVLVLNGEATTVSYTVADNLGGTVTKSLVANVSSGADTFTLPDAGITSVTIRRTTSSAFWDFLIDNVSFTAFPTTTAECKGGGWEAFGAFKNQGDCVSYVATGGKNQPAG